VGCKRVQEAVCVRENSWREEDHTWPFSQGYQLLWKMIRFTELGNSEKGQCGKELTHSVLVLPNLEE
jgi:hypothetical protein